MDSDFKLQLETDRVFTCEKHFHPHEIEICKFEFLHLFISITSWELSLGGAPDEKP